LSNTITRAEKKQRLNLIRQINSRNYRVEKKVTLLLQRAYIRFILSQNEDGLDLIRQEHAKIMGSTSTEEMHSDNHSEIEYDE